MIAATLPILAGVSNSALVIFAGAFVFGFILIRTIRQAGERAQRPIPPPPGVTPPGWYADPQVSSGLRYWDGQRWTDHRAPA